MKSFYTLLFCFLMYSVTNAQNLNGGLLMHYTFSGNADDVSGNNIHGEVIGAELTNDRFGCPENAYQFSEGKYINIKDTLLYKIDFPMSVSVWVYPEDISNDTYYKIFANCDDLSLYKGIGVYLHSGQVSAVIGNGGTPSPHNRVTLETYNKVNVNEWNHIVVVYNSISSVEIYLNGVLENTLTHGNTNNMSYGNYAGNAKIGGYVWGNLERNFVGKIDDFMFWGRALEFDDILSLYNTVNDDSLNRGLVLHYPLDGNADDLGPHSLNGNTLNTSMFCDRFGNQNSSLMFNGSSSRIDIPSSDFYKINFPISLSAWIFPKDDSDDSYYKIFTNCDDENTYKGIAVYLHSGQICGVIGNASTPRPESRLTHETFNKVNIDEWNHIAVVFNNYDDVNIYLNGNIEQTFHHGSANRMSYGNYVGNAKIGGYIWGNLERNFLGAIDDLKIWGRSLVQCDINKLYDIQNPVNFCENDSLLTFVVADIPNQVFSIYPNPTNDIITIKTTITNTLTNISTLSGVGIINSDKNIINVEGLANGVYIVIMTDMDTGKQYYSKLLKE